MTTIGKFQLEESELGSGGYGVVVRAKDTETGEPVAAKVIDKRKMKLEAIRKEVGLLSKLNHPYVIGLRGQMEVENHMFIFMELAMQGELFGRVIEKGCLTEDEARPYFTQLMEALQYLHSRGVAHRDLKLENVLLQNDVCKVIDFGLAHPYEVDDKGNVLKPAPLRETCGSKSYAAPEVLDGRGYDGFPADVWSCGICLFAMLAGFFPLDEATMTDWRFERVKLATASGISATRTIFAFYERPCNLSRPVVDLIDGMLTITPAKRLQMSDVLGTAWLNPKLLAGSGGWDQYGNDVQAPRYRDLSGDGAMDKEAMIAALKQASLDEPMMPTYRAADLPPSVPAEQRAPPLLKKQAQIFCPDFHLEEL